MLATSANDHCASQARSTLNWRISVSKSESQKARIKLYRNKSFRCELADGLGVGGLRIQVASCLDALLEARRLPSRSDINSRAAAIDAALIMIAIGTIQTDGKAALYMTDRLGAMKLHKVVDTSDPAEREIPVAAATDLAADLATAFEEYWAARDGAFLEGLCHTALVTRIADAPADDAATLLRISDNRRNSYSAPTPPAAACERIRHTIRGELHAVGARQISPSNSGTISTVPPPRSAVRARPPWGAKRRRGRAPTKTTALPPAGEMERSFRHPGSFKSFSNMSAETSRRV
jgi:hypothetical protein